ncbi:MAG: right-handed parallel beta-helix repeat-containing protein [Acidimicrobiales bacterium]
MAIIVMATGILVALPSYPVDASRVPDLQCGVNPTTSVRLRADLTCSEQFLLAADNPPLTIDLGGHKLTFTDSSCAPGPPITRCDITDLSGSATIRNGTVAGSISLGENHQAPARGTLSQLRVVGHVDLWGASTISSSQLYAGVSAFGAVVLDHNTISGGVRVDDTLRTTPLDIVDNVIVASPGAGIDINVSFDFDRVGGTIESNTIRNSVGDGILIHGQGANGLGELHVTANNLVGNGGDGISYPQDNRFPSRVGIGPVVFARNTARHNAGHGIDIRDALTGDPAVGVFDGAGNTAKFNGLSPRCIGVDCDADPRAVPVITWAQPAPIVAGTPLGPDQLDATASVPGCLTYTPAAGTVLDPGGYSLVVKFVPDDIVNYQPISWGVSLEVTRQSFP